MQPETQSKRSSKTLSASGNDSPASPGGRAASTGEEGGKLQLPAACLGSRGRAGFTLAPTAAEDLGRVREKGCPAEPKGLREGQAPGLSLATSPLLFTAPTGSSPAQVSVRGHGGFVLPFLQVGMAQRREGQQPGQDSHK